MLVLSPHAKINWFLDVLGGREDGYHEIHSFMQMVSLRDRLVFEVSDKIEILTAASIPMENNLVYRAATLLKETTGISSGVKIELKKDIPVSAGLGGGSSDAAATLLGLNRLWELNLTKQELMKLGSRLGSDVPFFFHGPVAFVEGRGEIVLPLRLDKAYIILLVKPYIEVSAAWAYSELHNSGFDLSAEASMRTDDEVVILTKKDNNIKLLCHALENGDFASLSSLMKNDLEPCVVKRYPVINTIKNNLLAKGALFSLMSGSGPTVFAVFENESQAVEAMKSLPEHWCRVVKTLINEEQSEGDNLNSLIMMD